MTKLGIADRINEISNNMFGKDYAQLTSMLEVKQVLYKLFS